MRRLFMAGGLVVWGLGGAHAIDLGHGKNVVDPVYIQEGDTAGPLPFAVDCSSHLWVTVVSTDTFSRSVMYQALDDNAGGVCLSTITTTAYTCSDSTPGPELKPGASMTDYTTARWNCRSRADNVDTLKGYRSKNSGDK